MSQMAFKVVLLGEGRVGKTSLCLRYVQNSFSDKQKSTITATYLDKFLNIGQKSVKLMIWDTAGQERFHALGPIYYRDANGALLVYDITDRDSFRKVRNWVKELRKIVGKDIVLCIVGNKVDLEKKRQVDKEEALKYAEQVGAVHCLASAKTGRGVEQAFLELTKGLLKKATSSSGNRRSINSRRNIKVAPQNPEQKGPCCG
uniref:Ras-related protein Rab-21 n=1 Tax=Lotharella globosa TaxID=91324 RepID=A0A6V3JWJ8_9EUKA|mmetsp:Transcript_16780/g.33902  ORF Transcript_16780/g.33902 Transcript_16780/m.33902 type:complete len:202 (-) Transcript_16780:210-815(-)